MYTKEGHIVILALYMDDAILASNNRVKSMLHKCYDMKDIGQLTFVLGVQLLRDRENRTLTLHQTKYIHETLCRFNLADAKPASTPGTVGQKLSQAQSPQDDKEKAAMCQIPYRHAIGCLNYIACWTRPDIQHAVSSVSQYLENPGQDHWMAVKRILRYLKGTSTYGLCIQLTPANSSKLQLTAAPESRKQ